MKSKPVGFYENPTKKDAARISLDIEMAKKRQELEAKGLKPVSILPAHASDEEVLMALIRFAKTGKTQGLNGPIEDEIDDD